jgi:alpha-L-fucosidase
MQRVEPPAFEPSRESLAQHEPAPEWLKDAKLGIYFHWGVYSVPAYGSEWYPRWMYFDWTPIARHHRETYGSPAEFGYHDFVPMFKAEHFDPAEWAELFQQTGARFAGPVAEHHDGFSMWASKVTPWNVRDKGPKRDILGDLFTSLKKRNIKTIATFHHARNLQRYRDSWQTENMDGDRRAFRTSHYPYLPGLPTSSEDPELRYLYGNLPEDQWIEEVWFGKLREVIDNYQPDIIWFDSWLDQIPENYRWKFAAYYLNQANNWGREVAIVRKQDDLPLAFSINDHEKSREPKALPELWMTDDTISKGSWCYTGDLQIKPADMVIHALIDTVSKNGVLLLNISPKADGTIPQDQRDVMLELGAWLKANGEAIYETRQWINAAEGPTTEPEGGFGAAKEFLKLKYSARDIRYTAAKNGKTVYAILLGIPDAGAEVLLETFAREGVAAESVSLLSGEAVDWKMTAAGLQITAPQIDEKYAAAFKIGLKK